MGWGGRILYTRELDARHISTKTERDRLKGGQRHGVKSTKRQSEQRALTPLLFNVRECGHGGQSLHGRKTASAASEEIV